MAEVTILSGPIGAGKTAVSKALIALWSAPLAYIEGDQFWPFLVMWWRQTTARAPRRSPRSFTRVSEKAPFGSSLRVRREPDRATD